ncbi:MAG TPA: VOC family protein [Terriglobales bacterium]|nr:VOC family protein [Terriglobales bacterium]
MKKLATLGYLLVMTAAVGSAQRLHRPAIIGISHVTLRSANLKRSQQFYGGVLGFPKEAAGNRPDALRFRINRQQYIEVVATDDKADRLFEIGFQTTDAEQLRRYLAEEGIEVPGRVEAGADGSRSFYVRDPEGHELSFVQEPSARPVGGPDSEHQQISTQMIHAGFIVRDRAEEDHFYKDVLGFHVYWHGGMKNGQTDWVDMQVPDGTDWLEYMLNVEANPSPREAGVMRHLALGVTDIKPAVKLVKQRGWPMPEKAQVGLDGKWQLNLYDPDLTRVEVMGFQPVRRPCCAPYTGPHPVPR